MAQTFLTMHETMAALGVTRQTVVNLVARGKLKKYVRPIGQGRGGTRVVFDAAEVKALGELTPAAVEIGETEAKRRAKRSRK